MHAGLFRATCRALCLCRPGPQAAGLAASRNHCRPRRLRRCRHPACSRAAATAAAVLPVRRELTAQQRLRCAGPRRHDGEHEQQCQERRSRNPRRLGEQRGRLAAAQQAVRHGATRPAHRGEAIALAGLQQDDDGQDRDRPGSRSRAENRTRSTPWKWCYGNGVSSRRASALSIRGVPVCEACEVRLAARRRQCERKYPA